MSIQTELTRLTNAKAAIKAAIEGKGVTVPDATLLDGMASLIESIEAGGGAGIELPTGYKVSTGTYTPNTEGSNVEHDIKIASSCPRNAPCRMFCIYRVDGFDASGSDSTRYLTFYVGVYAEENATSGAVLYRNVNASTLTCAGGAETTNTPNYGLPKNCFINRTNCYIRNVSLDGVLKFSTYGVVTLESGKTYKWFALLPSDAEV